MSTSYAVVQLMRFDEQMKSNNESVNPVSSNTTAEIDVSNQSVEVKRSSRLSRKRIFQDKSVIEDVDHTDNIKKKKCSAKNAQSIKTEPAKSIVPQKDSKKPKSPILTAVKLTENNSTNDDFNKMSDTESSSFSINNEMTVTRQNPLKTPQNKKTKSINPVKKNNLVNNIDEDVSNEGEKNEKLEPLKINKRKISKTSASIKKDPVSNVYKNNISNELVKNDNFPLSKSPKNKISKSNIPAKKTFLENNIHKESIPMEDALNDNSVSLKPIKNKSNNGKKNVVVNNTNKNNMSADFEESYNSTPSKILRSKSSAKSSIKKKLIMNNVKKNDMNIEIEEKSDAFVFPKRGRPSLKKVQSLNANVGNICNNEIDSKQTTDMVIAIDKLPNIQKPGLTKDPNDNMMMLRSNNKPPKIKKKWSEEWSGDKLLNNVLKLNNDDHLGQKIDLSNCSKTIKKVMKTPKSKNTSYKKVKTKMLEKLDENTTNSFSIKSLNTSVHFDMSNTNIPGSQNQDHLLTTNSIPFTESIAVSNDVITEPNSNKIITNVPFVCDEAKTISSFEVTTEPTTCTESSTLSIEIPITSTELSNNAVTYENDQPSNLITSESIFNSTSSSFPMGYSESAEISYGIAILSEAISRQCRELNEESVKTKSSEQNINEIQSSPKKTSNSSRSQVPSAMVSPQKVNEHSNTSKVADKYSELCEPSVKTDLQSRAEREILLLSKRFNIPIESLRKTVIEEPLSVFHKKYSESITPSMITISPIVKDVETKTKPNTNYLSGSLDVEYKVEPIREAAAYEKTNLKDLMEELTKTMPSWTLSIVTNPPRYLISHMSINTYGVPFANKVIVLDKLFRASVYINQSLEHTYCKPYTTATEIVNLIKELNSI